MKDISNATANIGRNLREAERNTDRAIASIAAVTMHIANARADCDDLELLRTHGVSSQQQLLRLDKLQTSLLQGRGDMARVHGGLLDIGRVIMGPDMGDDCEETKRSFIGSLRSA